MLKQFLAKHFGLVELTGAEKMFILKAYKKEIDALIADNSDDINLWAKHFCSRLTALEIPFTYNKRTGLR